MRLYRVEVKFKMKGHKKVKWHEYNIYKRKPYAEKVAKNVERYFGKGKTRVKPFEHPGRKK